VENKTSSDGKNNGIQRSFKERLSEHDRGSGVTMGNSENEAKCVKWKAAY